MESSTESQQEPEKTLSRKNYISSTDDIYARKTAVRIFRFLPSTFSPKYQFSYIPTQHIRKLFPRTFAQLHIKISTSLISNPRTVTLPFHFTSHNPQ
ncbi:hypothetical protein F2P81_018619 [Scophthalmus maximus]|uniref:Uncharacterized protein n=1 Tax=Scophthalmus maximus TaxID=52904 RepID=A0A6A4SF46_SCOMX|nr:hypothetical protein F2P81_018619 [Scophthalmus maximus]